MRTIVLSVPTILRTAAFAEWLNGLTDDKAFALVAERIERAAAGNFGDIQPIADGDGLSELRIHYGPGYRLYVRRTGADEYTLILGGTKRTQKRDIRKARG